MAKVGLISKGTKQKVGIKKGCPGASRPDNRIHRRSASSIYHRQKV